MEAKTPVADEGWCVHVDRCRLAAGDAPWPFARAHAEAIERHWRYRRAELPQMFNGVVYVLGDHAIDDGTLAGTFLKTDFKTFLYWREEAHVDADGVCDSFGAALIRSAEGHVLFGWQGPGHLNSGYVYPPSGLIDGNDAVGGAIDIEASIVRELREETGLEATDLKRTPGYFLAQLPRQLAIAAEFRSPLASDQLRERMLSFIRSQAQPELADIVIVRTRADIDALPLTAYARVLLRARLPA